MGMFKKSPRIPNAGGLMDVIRCDEPSYLIWKWHPAGSEQGNNKRENAIRIGSSLRVKDGEVAVFVYHQKDGTMQDFIEGPFDETLKTKNLPILSGIVGLAFDGGTPFQAEVYFINLSGVIQIPFAVPYFDLYDPRFLDFGVPTAVRGKLSFNIKDYKEFIKLHRLIHFDLTAFQNQIKDSLVRYVKSAVMNVPEENNIPVVQIERKIEDINAIVEAKVKERLERDFGVTVLGFDINAIEIDKTSEGYQQLKAVTKDIAFATAQTQAEMNLKNLRDMQRINSENMEETLRVQREEAQYAQHMQSKSSNINAYQLEKQAEVGVAGANALGQMGANGAMEMSGNGGMNPAAMMTGIAMGGAIGQNMAGMMNGMMSGVSAPQQTGGNQQMLGMAPPPIPYSAYNVVVNGQATGPFDMGVLSQMVSAGTITKESLVWKQGMTEWVKAGNVQELLPLFADTIPQAPPVPGGMPPIPPV